MGLFVTTKKDENGIDSDNIIGYVRLRCGIDEINLLFMLYLIIYEMRYFLSLCISCCKWTNLIAI